MKETKKRERPEVVEMQERGMMNRERDMMMGMRQYGINCWCFNIKCSLYLQTCTK